MFNVPEEISLLEKIRSLSNDDRKYLKRYFCAMFPSRPPSRFKSAIDTQATFSPIEKRVLSRCLVLENEKWVVVATDEMLKLTGDFEELPIAV